jgi:hypothetical protein
MKKKSRKLIGVLTLLFVTSCNEPETTLTDFVHHDGSVTRRIEMKSTDNKSSERFRLSGLQVPFDSTWTIKDSITVNQKGDTSWIRTAEKVFVSVEGINLSYKDDSGANKNISRQASFKKRFKWFNTEIWFSEKIDKNMSFGYPVRDFLNKEELLYFYSPDDLQKEKLNGPDSIKYKVLSDSVKLKTDNWTYRNIVSEWIGEFSELTEGRGGNVMLGKSLKAREAEFVKIVEANEKNLDSLWSKGILLKKFLGVNDAIKYKPEADSALEIVTKRLLPDFKDYSVRIVMPGNIIGTNGFIDSSKTLLWPVKSDYFLTEPYEMWAESKTINAWAWIISGLFLAFVLAGVLIRLIKKN